MKLPLNWKLKPLEIDTQNQGSKGEKLFKTKISQRINFKQFLRIVIFILLLVNIIGQLIPISYGIENLRLMQIFSTDETNAVKSLLNNLKYDDLDPRGFYNYGYFYHSVGFYIVKLLKAFGFKVDTMLVAIVLRLISWFSFILVGIIIYIIFTKLFHGQEEYGLLLALMLLSLPEFADWSRLVHPDMLQVFLIEIAVFAAFSSHQARFAIFASALAGIAFGTKYSGIFILPFLLLPYIFRTFINSPKTLKNWTKILVVCIAAVIIFITMWMVTNPYAIKNFQEFRFALEFEKKHVSTGHGKLESGNPFLWFPVLWNLFGPLNSIMVGFALIFLFGTLIHRLKRDKVKKFLQNHINRNLITLILFILASLSYLMLEVRMRVPRYLFHFLPFILLIAILGFQKINDLNKKPLIKYIILLGLIVSISLTSFQSLSNASKATRKYEHHHITAGNFLAENEPGNLRVVASSYSYVPPKFRHVIFRFWIDEKLIKKFRPDIIIMNAEATKRWSWKRTGTSFKDLNLVKGGNIGKIDYYRFQQKLFSPGSPWNIIYETDHIVILKKQKPANS